MGCGDTRSHHPRVYHSRRISRGTDDRRNSVRCTHRGGPVHDTPLAAHYRWSRQLHKLTGTARHVLRPRFRRVSVDMASALDRPQHIPDGRRLAIRTALYQRADRTRRTQEQLPRRSALSIHPYTVVPSGHGIPHNQSRRQSRAGLHTHEPDGTHERYARSNARGYDFGDTQLCVRHT